jgi:predicted small secreted protein
MTAAASFGLQRSGKFANGSVGSGLSGRISEAWPTLAPPGECFAQAPRKNFHAAIDAALRRWSLAALAVIAPRKPSLLREKRARLVPDPCGRTARPARGRSDRRSRRECRHRPATSRFASYLLPQLHSLAACLPTLHGCGHDASAGGDRALAMIFTGETLSAPYLFRAGGLILQGP